MDCVFLGVLYTWRTASNNSSVTFFYHVELLLSRLARKV